MKPSLRCSSGVVLLLLVSAAFAQTPDPNSPIVLFQREMALQGADMMNPLGVKGAPVRVVGTASQGNNLMTRITVQNNSAKGVSALEYGWRITSPANCSESTLAAQWDTARVKVAVAIASGESAQIETPESLSKDGTALTVTQEALASHSPVVLITVGIISATFTDGETWVDSEAARTRGTTWTDENAAAVSAAVSRTGKQPADCHQRTLKEMKGKRSCNGGGSFKVQSPVTLAAVQPPFACGGTTCSLRRILNNTCSYTVCWPGCGFLGCDPWCIDSSWPQDCDLVVWW